MILSTKKKFCLRGGLMKERAEDLKLINEISALTRRMRLLRKHNAAAYLLSEVELLILDFLEQNPEQPPTMRQVAKAIGITFSNLSKIINGMEIQKGWVERTIDPHDRRQILLAITQQGKAILEKAKREQRERLGLIIPRLSSEDREIVARGIAVFNRILDEAKL
jgi:DNA-binding MarR family transcriptional regulator